MAEIKETKIITDSKVLDKLHEIRTMSFLMGAEVSKNYAKLYNGEVKDYDMELSMKTFEEILREVGSLIKEIENKVAKCN